MKKLCLVLLTLFICGLVSGCGNAFEGSAAQFAKESYSDFYENKGAKYDNKSIKLSGRVIEKGEIIDGSEIYLIIYSDFIKTNNRIEVGAGFSPKMKNTLNKVKIGDFVMVQGTYKGPIEDTKDPWNFVVYLTDCKLVN